MGLFIKDILPAVLASDVVGTVVALGPGVTKYKVGDRVVSQAAIGKDSPQTGLQEYAVNDVDHGFKIPDSVSNDEGATVPTNAIASVVGLFAGGDKGLGIPAPWDPAAKDFDYAGTTLLIVGGGTNCGKVAVQLAKLAGIGKVIAVGGSEDELKSFGATSVLDRHGGFDAVLKRIQSAVGDDLVYAFDTVNMPEGQLLGLNALSSTKKGKFARLLPVTAVDDSKVIGKKAGYDVINVWGLSHAIPSVAIPFWDRVGDLLTSGKLKPTPFVVKKGLNADDANVVFDAYSKGERVVQTHFHIREKLNSL
jgi:NADPH2:quinone reductase